MGGAGQLLAGLAVGHRGVDSGFSAVIPLLVQQNGRRRACLVFHFFVLWAGVFVCFVQCNVLDVLVVPTAHVPPGVDHLLCGHSTHAGLGAGFYLWSPSADGKSLRIISFLAYNLRQNSSASIDEPVADLEDGQTCFLRQRKLLCVTGVGVVSVVVEPSSQHKYGFLGQVSSSLPCDVRSRSQTGLLTARVLVSTGGSVTRHSLVNHLFWRVEKIPILCLDLIVTVPRCVVMFCLLISV